MGKLELEVPFQELSEKLQENKIEILPIEFEHLLVLYTLNMMHRDPFDRIIISQAISENLTLLSGDSEFTKYQALDLLW